MLSKFEEWYEVLQLKTTDEGIVQLRKKSIDKVISYIKQPKNKKLLFEAVTFFTYKGDPESGYIQFLINSLKEDDPDFVDDLSKRKKELQVLSAIILGELIQSSTNNNKARLLCSISLLAGMNIPFSNNLLAKKLSKIHFDIRILIENALFDDGEIFRAPVKKLTKFGHEKFVDNPADILSNPKDILNIFTNIEREIQDIKSNGLREKEHREIYWWVLGKRSMYSEELFSEMTLGSAVMSAGCELADITMFPPQANFHEFLSDVLFFGVKYNELEIDLVTLVKDWEEATLQRIQPKTKGSEALIYEFPKLFPLSWILLNKLNNNMSDEWTSLLYKQTGIAKGVTLQGSQWAYQAMVERYCLRAYLT